MAMNFMLGSNGAQWEGRMGHISLRWTRPVTWRTFAANPLTH